VLALYTLVSTHCSAEYRHRRFSSKPTASHSAYHSCRPKLGAAQFYGTGSSL